MGIFCIDKKGIKVLRFADPLQCIHSDPQHLEKDLKAYLKYKKRPQTVFEEVNAFINARRY